ncbi:general substrate transporter [Thozetella sp. PMI_491]|nr:general substrate transporter [Thozetella sp. PMI_491]
MAGGRGNIFVGKSAFKSATPRLFFICLVYSLGSVFFGYDGASFGGVQAFQPFLKVFGSYNGTTKKYSLPSSTASLMNSLPLLGKFTGAIIVGPLTERFGHRYTMTFTCAVQIVGAIIQVTSFSAPQFVAGRFLVYTAVGLVENVVPTYQSEIAPAALRGFFVGSIQLCLTFGSLIAGIVNQAMSSKADNTGWQIATGIQGIPAVMILAGLYFTPDSPRWLAYKDRAEDAIKVLRQVRRKEDVDNGVCELEIAAMLEDRADVNQKGPWMDLFTKKNLRRTGIACSIMALQQLTGVTFSSSYGPTFYTSVGLGSMAFSYAAISNGVSVVTAMLAMIFLDIFGRRDLTLHGCWTQGVFLALIGALGSKTSPTQSETQGMVASFIIYAAILHASLGPSAYITAAEVGTTALREKTMAFSTAINVVVGFVVVFTTPYLLAILGAKLGYVWMGFSFLGCVWVFFCMPELKGRNLEEIDELFEANLPAWRFHKYETTGLSRELNALENGRPVAKNVDNEGVDMIENTETGAGRQA